MKPTDHAPNSRWTKSRPAKPATPSEMNGGFKPKKKFGDKPAFGKKRTFGEKRDFGDRPSFPKKRDFSESREFGDKPAFSDRPSFPKKREFGDKPAFGKKPPFGKKRPFGEKRDFGDRPRSFGPKKFGPKKATRSFPIPNEDAPVELEAAHAIESEMPQALPSEEALPVADSSGIHFSELDLPEELEKALAALKFENPTPIQAQSLPHTLAGFDLIGCAQTGTGKTLAFALPMIARLMEDEDSLALILAPTRELAMQIIDTIRKLTPFARHIQHALIIGGAGYREQVMALRRGPRIVVATPGRLVDHLQQGTIRLGKVKFFVLDEADRMFDMGFAPQLKQIVDQLPPERQTLLFSATFSKEVKALAMKSLKDPKEVFVGAPSQAATGVEQAMVETTNERKLPLLLDELNQREGTVLIFAGMKYKAERLARTLADYGHKVDFIHGGRTQGQRKNALRSFREQSVRILVATDVAARGLDIPHVAHVINYDLPKDPEDYIHRIGRTARAGAVGKALSFVTREERGDWKKISRLLAKKP